MPAAFNNCWSEGSKWSCSKGAWEWDTPWKSNTPHQASNSWWSQSQWEGQIGERVVATWEVAELLPQQASEPGRRRREHRNNTCSGGHELREAADEAAGVSEPENVGFQGQDRWVDILRARFSQEQVHPFFHRRGPIQDVLQDINSEPSMPEEHAPGDTIAAPTVRLLPPFEPIRCLHSKLHGDWISLDNRRLYALQLAAVERWPARCLARIRDVSSSCPAVLQAEARKLERGGLGPLGSHPGKPQAFLEQRCGDVEVLVASRGTAWEPWHPAGAVLQRCGVEVAQASVAEELALEAHPCKQALGVSMAVFQRERAAHAAVADAATVAAHGVLCNELREALESLRCAAAAAPGILVRRVGAPGDRDGYVSVAAQAAALLCLAGASRG